jgi:hypothetical protein
MAAPNLSPQLCAICGAADATTKDHLPPKNIFPKPRPNDLIKVPTCFRCNNVGSKYDEEFRVFPSLRLGTENETTRKLWKDGALRTLKHNNRLTNKLISNLREVDVRTSAGIFLGTRRAVTMPLRTCNAVLDRIVRGLYFHHYGEILGSRVSCGITGIKRQENILNEMAPIIEQMAFASIANDAFSYRYSRVGESPLYSMWLLMFQQHYLVHVETLPKSRSNAAIQGTKIL